MAVHESLESLDGDAVHVVLLGDSTLDNGRYLNVALGELSVEKQLLKRCEERGWEMTVLAQDGSMLDDVRQRQVPLIPPTATHVVVSASGNDLLSLLNEMVVANFTFSSMRSAIGAGLQKVASSYREILQTLKSFGVHLTCCTVYRPNFNHFFFKSLAIFSLALYNTRVRQMSVELECSVIDLANIFDCSEDFANPLELSTRGGSKVVENISSFIVDHPTSMLNRRRPGNGISYRDDDHFLPCSPSTFGQCCATRVPLRKVYASKRCSEDLELPDEVLAGGQLGPALEFSEQQQQWRELR